MTISFYPKDLPFNFDREGDFFWGGFPSVSLPKNTAFYIKEILKSRDLRVEANRNVPSQHYKSKKKTAIAELQEYWRTTLRKDALNEQEKEFPIPKSVLEVIFQCSGGIHSIKI